MKENFRRVGAWVSVCLFAAGSCWAGSFTPTTTYSDQTSNNTSASSSFKGLSNGDEAPGNVSKLSIHTLAPSGFAGKFFAHYMPWWGNSGHMNIGYSSKDATQISKIVTDMKSRGYDGVILAEANTIGYDEDSATLFAQAASAAGLEVIASENHLNSVSNPMSRLEQDMSYFKSHYFNLSHYYRINGRPVVIVFDDNSSVDWKAVSGSSTYGSPLFVYRNSSALSNSTFAGGFSWFGGFSSSDPYGLNYLSSFYAKALTEPSSRIVGGDYWKGFNDTLAPWTQHRIMNQRCGQTWLKTLGELSVYASHPNSLPIVQVATWDDYEEGTEVETGIDNCGSVTAAYSVSNNALDFSPVFSSSDGTEATVDHYEIYASQDGSNLMLLSKLPAGSRSFSLDNLSIPSGSYIFYVKMVGKSHILNHMSSGVKIDVQSGPTPSPTPSPAPSPSPSSSSAYGIVISSPTAGASVGSPVSLSLQVKEKFTISRIQIWDSVSGSKLADLKPNSTQYSGTQSFSLQSGVSHTLTINVLDSSYTTKDHKTIQFSVQAAAPTYGISISSPTAGSSVSSPVPVRFNVSENFTISRIQIWDSVSGSKIADIQANSTKYSVNQSFSLKSGVSHTLTINIKDSSFTTKDHAQLQFTVK